VVRNKKKTARLPWAGFLYTGSVTVKRCTGARPKRFAHAASWFRQVGNQAPLNPGPQCRLSVRDSTKIYGFWSRDRGPTSHRSSPHARKTSRFSVFYRRGALPRAGRRHRELNSLSGTAATRGVFVNGHRRDDAGPGTVLALPNPPLGATTLGQRGVRTRSSLAAGPRLPPFASLWHLPAQPKMHANIGHRGRFAEDVSNYHGAGPGSPPSRQIPTRPAPIFCHPPQ